MMNSIINVSFCVVGVCIIMMLFGIAVVIAQAVLNTIFKRKTTVIIVGYDKLTQEFSVLSEDETSAFLKSELYKRMNTENER